MGSMYAGLRPSSLTGGAPRSTAPWRRPHGVGRPPQAFDEAVEDPSRALLVDRCLASSTVNRCRLRVPASGLSRSSFSISRASTWRVQVPCHFRYWSRPLSCLAACPRAAQPDSSIPVDAHDGRPPRQLKEIAHNRDLLGNDIVRTFAIDGCTAALGRTTCSDRFRRRLASHGRSRPGRSKIILALPAGWFGAAADAGWAAS